ncbi:MAG: hypothetical protein R3B70_08275 [Polyangiaceae bacterium]
MTKRARSRGALARSPLRDAVASASSGRAEAAAHDALAAGGSAVDAVIAGFFAAAGAEASVLLGSVAAIVANAGSGVRAFDGRPLQPGKGAARPRGFVEGAEVPDGARVAVPRAVPLVMLLHAYAGRSAIATLARHGAESAAEVDATRRARVLRGIGSGGAFGLRSEGVHDALLAAGNSLAGGSLTEADLDGVLSADGDALAVFRTDGESPGLVSAWPWCTAGASDEDAGWSIDVVAAADSRGNMAALSYAHQPDGVPLPGVELSAPRVAVPVRRAVTRVTPGAELRAPAPIGVARFGRELSLAFGLVGSWKAGEPALFQDNLTASAFELLGEGAAVEKVLAALAQANTAERAVAAVRSPKTTRSVVIVPGAAAESA